MPAKNSRKIYVEDCYYHVYNRGVDKRGIFLDDQDHRTFLHLLKIYLSPPREGKPALTRTDLVRLRSVRSLYGEVELITYCLMPNHFHLLLKQKTVSGMTELMRKIGTAYVMYFNDRYTREGTLFQGTYKAVPIDSEAYLLHVSRYIHQNPLELGKTNALSYPYSSYPIYLGLKSTEWVNPEPILDYFGGNKKLPAGLRDHLSYQDFVENYRGDSAAVLGNLTLE